jgi:ubiquinone/menaquinone biosynthesis C-methylase UbiE
VEIQATRNSGFLICHFCNWLRCFRSKGSKLFDLTNSNNLFAKEVKHLNSESVFEKTYLDIRQKESRIYSDDQVALLPFISDTHVHFQEWGVRMRSAGRLLKYLKKKYKPLSILEMGCGNGWLSAMMASVSDSKVLGKDVNSIELNQAKRVFNNKMNVGFDSGGLENIGYSEKFDVIVFAASIQYFPFFEKTINKAISCLNPGGEIHILDSHFYHTGNLEQARRRSYFYYESLGYSEMAKFYFHHTWKSLNEFQFDVLFNPLSLKNKIIFAKDPFPWIRISSI